MVLSFLALAGAALVLIVLAANPQWHPAIYTWRAAGAPGGWLPAPADYDGEWRAWRPDGTLWYKGSYAGGQPFGVHSFYRPGGSRACDFSFPASPASAAEARWPAGWTPDPEGKSTRPEGLSGEWIVYGEDGRVLYRGLFRDGRETGVHSAVTSEGDRLEIPFVDGARHGDTRIYYPAGELKMVDPWVEGQRHGLLQAWHQNGQPQLNQEFVAGARHGAHSQWTEDGEPALQENFRDDRLEGASLRFGPGGQLARQDTYAGGVLEGLSIEYGPGGRPLAMTEYRGGLASGLRRQWRADGRPLAVETFRDGRRAGPAVYYDADGRRTRQAGYRDNDLLHGWVIEWRPDGTRRSAVPHENNRPQGWGVEYDESGQPATWRLHDNGRIAASRTEPPPDWREPPEHDFGEPDAKP